MRVRTPPGAVTRRRHNRVDAVGIRNAPLVVTNNRVSLHVAGMLCLTSLLEGIEDLGSGLLRVLHAVDLDGIASIHVVAEFGLGRAKGVQVSLESSDRRDCLEESNCLRDLEGPLGRCSGAVGNGEGDALQDIDIVADTRASHNLLVEQSVVVRGHPDQVSTELHLRDVDLGRDLGRGCTAKASGHAAGTNRALEENLNFEGAQVAQAEVAVDREKPGERDGVEPTLGLPETSSSTSSLVQGSSQ
jgi:hypothetical protein